MKKAHTRRSMAATLLVELFAAAVAPVSVIAQAPTIRPGLYERVTEVSMPGRPTKTPGRKDTKCVTPGDLKDWNNLVGGMGPGSDERGGCKIVDRKTTATTAIFTKECATARGTFNAKVEISVIATDSYRAVLKTSQSPGAANPMFQDVTITSTARRTGDCAK